MHNATLGVIKKAPRIGLGEGFAFRHHGRKGVSPVPNLMDVGTFGGERFGRRIPWRRVIGPLGDSLKLALLAACRELVADFGERRLTHAAPKRSGHDRPLIGNGFALEQMVAGEGHRLLSTDRGRLAYALLDRSLAGFCNNPARFIAELGGDLPMRLQHLLFREVLFLFAGSCARRSLRLLAPYTHSAPDIP